MTRSAAYFDTSVLVKRYLVESGSVRARALLRRHRPVSSIIAPLEATAALLRRQSAGDLAPQDLDAILVRLRRDHAHWGLIEVSAPVLDRAEELIRTASTALRTLDALHLASALLVQSAGRRRLPFVTADGRQREAATVWLDVVWVD